MLGASTGAFLTSLWKNETILEKEKTILEKEKTILALKSSSPVGQPSTGFSESDPVWIEQGGQHRFFYFDRFRNSWRTGWGVIDNPHIDESAALTTNGKNLELRYNQFYPDTPAQDRLRWKVVDSKAYMTEGDAKVETVMFGAWYNAGDLFRIFRKEIAGGRIDADIKMRSGSKNVTEH